MSLKILSIQLNTKNMIQIENCGQLKAMKIREKTLEYFHKAKSIDDKNAVLKETRQYEDGMLLKTTKHN